MSEGDHQDWDELDGEPPPTEEELRAAEALRRALEHHGNPRGDHHGNFDGGVDRGLGGSLDPEHDSGRAPVRGPDRSSPPADGPIARPAIELAQSLRVAWDPPEVPPLVERRAWQMAIDRAGASRRRRWTAVTLAAAAAVLVVSSSMVSRGRIEGTALVPRRSAADLFEAPFGRDTRATERVDVIAEARSRDMRANWYARHGVRTASAGRIGGAVIEAPWVLERFR